MNKIAFIGAAFLMVGCMAVNARTAHTGHLIVSLTDRETGGPITNAMVKVRVQTKRSIGGHSSPRSSFAISDSKADSHGVANVAHAPSLPRCTVFDVRAWSEKVIFFDRVLTILTNRARSALHFRVLSHCGLFGRITT